VPVDGKVTRLNLATASGSCREIEVIVVPTITAAFTKVAVPPEVCDKISRNIVMADTVPSSPETVQIEVLLGNNYYSEFLTGERKEVTPGLFLLASEFGWILSGRISEKPTSLGASAIVNQVMAMNSAIQMKENPDECLQQLWSLEHIIVANEDPSKSCDDEAVDQYDRSHQSRRPLQCVLACEPQDSGFTVQFWVGIREAERTAKPVAVTARFASETQRDFPRSTTKGRNRRSHQSSPHGQHRPLPSPPSCRNTVEEHHQNLTPPPVLEIPGSA
jgi:hypothetical protein